MAPQGGLLAKLRRRAPGLPLAAPGLLLVAPGAAWDSKPSPGCSWLLLAAPGGSWLSASCSWELLGCLWLFLGVLGRFLGCLWLLLAASDASKASMACPGCSWLLQEASRTHPRKTLILPRGERPPPRQRRPPGEKFDLSSNSPPGRTPTASSEAIPLARNVI